MVPIEGDSASAGLNRIVGRQLAASVAVPGYTTVVEGDFSGADLRVTGGVERVGNELTLRLTLGDRHLVPELGSVITVTGDANRPEAVVAHAAREILVRWPGGAATELARAAIAGTASPAAARSFLIGEAAYRRGRFLDAVNAFSDAVAKDSAFAMASYRLSQAILAADLHGVYDDDHVARLGRSLDRLGPRERNLAWSYLHFRQGHAERAEQLARSAATVGPGSVEGWIQLGETLFHYNPLRGRPITEAIEPFDRALALDSTNAQALLHRALLSAYLEDRSGFLRLSDALLALQPDPGIRTQVELMRSIVRRDRTSTARLAAQLGNADDLRLVQAIWRTSVYLKDLPAATELARSLVAPRQSRYSQEWGRVTLIALLFAQGREAEARAQLDSALQLGAHSADPLPARAFAVLLSPAVLPSAERRRLFEQHQAGARDTTMLGRCIEGLVAADEGDQERVAMVVARLDPAIWQCALLVVARLELRRGNPAAALALLETAEQMAPKPWFGLALSSHAPFAAATRFSRAEALAGLGRGEEALNWYRSLGEFGPTDLAWTMIAATRSDSIRQGLAHVASRVRTEDGQ